MILELLKLPHHICLDNYQDSSLIQKFHLKRNLIIKTLSMKDNSKILMFQDYISLLMSLHYHQSLLKSVTVPAAVQQSKPKSPSAQLLRPQTRSPAQSES